MSRLDRFAAPTTPEFETIHYAKKGAQATITIDRPRALNSLNMRAFEEVQDAVRDAERDDAIAALVLTGTGDRAFCTGVDLHEHWELCQRPRDYAKWVQEFIAMQTRILRCGKPTIAQLNGVVLGGGNELNLACDLAIAADHVSIRQAGPTMGSVPAIGVTQWLPLVVGDRRAREIVFFCEDVPAEQALDWGLVNRVVPAAELDDAVADAVGKLTNKFPECIRYSKVQLNHLKEATWAATGPHGGDWLAIHSGSVETYEGMRAFQEKRPADAAAQRERAAADASPEFVNGPPVRECESCGADDIPLLHSFCGRCGGRLGDTKFS